VGVAGAGGEGRQPVDGHAAGVGVVVQPACHHEALGFAQPACERGVGGVGMPEGAWDIGTRLGDTCAVYGDAVGMVWGAVLEGLVEQVFKSGVGVEGALEVSVVAVGDGVGVRVLGA